MRGSKTLRATRASGGTLHDAYSNGARRRRQVERRAARCSQRLAADASRSESHAGCSSSIAGLLEQKPSDAPAADRRNGSCSTFTRQIRRQRPTMDRARSNAAATRFTIVLDEAIWQGKYFKTFTYYRGLRSEPRQASPPVSTRRTWIVQPSQAFSKFDGRRPPYVDRQIDNWPQDDESPSKKPPIELRKRRFQRRRWEAPKSEHSEGRMSRTATIDGLAKSDLDGLSRRRSDAGRSPALGARRRSRSTSSRLFNKVGCSNRSCHGSLQGQGGFQLSLFGYDPTLDNEAIASHRRPRSAHRHPLGSTKVWRLRKPLGKAASTGAIKCLTTGAGSTTCVATVDRRRGAVPRRDRASLTKRWKCIPPNCASPTKRESAP
jgi:hypothetical protein